MRDIKDLDRLTSFMKNYNMPKEQNIFVNHEEYLALEDMLSKFPSGIVIFKTPMSAIVPYPITIRYNGYTFNIFQY